MTTASDIADAIVQLPKPYLIAFDVDGTLSPIVARPESATVPPNVLADLETIASIPGTHVALITGRDRTKLQSMVPLPKLWRATLHGREIDDAQGRPLFDLETDNDLVAKLESFRSWLRLHAPDALIEEKPGAIGVHVRPLFDIDRQRAQHVLEVASAQAVEIGLFVRHGRAMVEAETMVGDKGAALERIAVETKARSVFFAGDDITDFSAIEFASRHGVGVFVSSDEHQSVPVYASGVLGGTDDVVALLRALVARLQAGR
ncbi:MAG: trehalose-phosphatase [Polyangiales bacterium]